MNRQSFLAYSIVAFALFVSRHPAPAQGNAIPPRNATPPSNAPTLPAMDALPAALVTKDYALGPGDQLSIQVIDLDEVFKADKPFTIDMSGDLSLPLVGRIHATGLTVAALERDVRNRLGMILKNPDVAINLASSSSQPVAVLGAVVNPGIRQLEGHKTLFEILSIAGGLKDNAGYQIKITRSMNFGPIPLPDAQIDSTGKFCTASVKVRTIIEEKNSAENILILPGDNISVPVAPQVYILGSVAKAGSVMLTEHESIPALQLVSTAEGFSKVAAPEKARILRLVPGSDKRVEMAVNLKEIFAGKIDDVQIQPNDILFIPSSRAKTVAYGAEGALFNATGVGLLLAHY